MNYNMKKIFLLLLPVILLAACDKQIDAIQPLTKIDKDGELSSVAGILEATVGNYALITGSGFADMSLPLQDLNEDRGNNVTLQDWGPANQYTDAFFFRNSPSPTNGNSAALYRGVYQVIVGVNTVLEGIASFQASQFEGLNTGDQNKVLYAKGENMFIRAFMYFNLVRIYGKPYYQDGGAGLSIPLKKTSSVSDVPSPASVKDVYAFIVSELQTAAQLMKLPVTKTNSFASTGAAWALLSRVCLYMGGTVASPDAAANQQAVAYADSVISSGNYALRQGSDYIQMFGDDEFGALGKSTFSSNKEIIYAFDNSAGGSYIGELYHHDQSYDVGAIFLPSSALRALFQPADVRGTFFKLNTSSNHTETTKWLCLNEAWLTRAPTIFLRLGEIYLNRAEAYAKLNNMTMARTDLKIIHTRAGLPGSDIDGLADGDVLSNVLLERRLELAFEGHNSFDYFRNGLPMLRSYTSFNSAPLTVNATDAKVVLRISDGVLAENGNIQQNNQ